MNWATALGNQATMKRYDGKIAKMRLNIRKMQIEMDFKKKRKESERRTNKTISNCNLGRI